MSSITVGQWEIENVNENEQIPANEETTDQKLYLFLVGVLTL